VLPSSPFGVRTAPPVESYTVGDRVTHDAFGMGRVCAVEGAQSVVVTFGETHVRVLSPFSKLTKL
jgi:hypothetical protein